MFIQKIILGTSTLALSAALSTAAYAQSETDENSVRQLDTIIVTAQKRQENLQDVPIAISALDSQGLERRGITRVDQISGFIPNIDIKNTVSFAGSSQILVASIRGIGQNDFAFNLEPGVGVYIDGVYFARSLGAVVDLLDLERIEVLKGPQGTLFGRNTIGGALNVITRRPKGEYGYQLELSTGSFSRTDVRGSVDIPLIEDQLLSQFSFSVKRRDGYQRRIPFPGAAGTVTDLGNFLTAGPAGGSDTQGGENVFNGRAKILWEPRDDFSLLLSADYTNANQEARSTTLLATFAGPTDGTALSAFNGCLFGAAPAFICSERGVVGTSFFGVNVDADPNNDRIPFTDALITGDIDTNFSRGSNFDDLVAWGVHATADYDFSPNVSLKSITAYRSLDSQFGAEIAGAPFVGNDASFDMNQTQFSQELQLNINLLDGRFKSILGAYYFTEQGGLTDTPIFGEGIIQIFGQNDFNNRAFAFFAHETFDITERWGVTFGARYTNERKDFEGFQQDLNSFFLRVRGADPNLPLPPEITAILPDPNDPTRIFPLGPNRLNFDDVSFKAGTEYRVTDDTLAYYSFSQGFKSGGFSTRLLDVVPGNSIDSLIFDPETANTHEVGVKSELFNNRVRLNAAVFTTDFNDIQVTVFNGISPVFSNAGQARIRGFELEGEARFGNLSLNAGLGHLDAEYTELGENVTFSITNDLVNTPTWSATIGGSYDIDLANNSGRISILGDFNIKSSTSPDAENSPFLRSGRTDILNTAIAYHDPNDRWSLTAGVNNLTDERFIVGGFDQSGPGQVGFVGASFSPPRQWFLTLRVKG